MTTEDREGDELDCEVLINPGDNEVVLSDRAVGTLGIVILDAGKGEWCFRDELGGRIRLSEQPQHW